MLESIDKIAERAVGNVIQREIEASVEREVRALFAQYELELSVALRGALVRYFEKRGGRSMWRRVFESLKVNGQQVHAP